MTIVKDGTKRKALTDAVKMLLDPDLDLDDKRMMCIRILGDSSPESLGTIENLLGLAADEHGTQKDVLKKQQQLDEMMQLLKDGPRRLATYVGPAPGTCGQLVKRAHVLMENGDTAFPAIFDNELAESLTCGDAVLLDTQVRMVIEKGPAGCFTGEVGELRQRIGNHRVRVALNDLSSDAFRVSNRLMQQLDSGEVEPGAEVLVCTRRRVAFEALPREEGLSHYKYLEQGPLQEVDIQRDIGHPDPFIDELLDHVRDEMTNPELNRKYGVRPMQTRLLKGRTGTGKTYSILGLTHGIYRVMSEVTGAPVDALPQRVLRMRMAQMLDKYLGESDKRQDRFYDEVAQLANETFTWDGREWKLPVIARCEEIDSLARTRNASEDVMGRILTTSLERLDHLSRELGGALCIFLFTTNVPELCDEAFVRRAGGQIIDFGRIGRAKFQAILSKKIRGLPIHPELGLDQEQAERRLAHDVTNWMFSPNGFDPGQVEITLAGSAETTTIYRRDLLTGSVVDLSVQQACAEAKQIEKQGTQTPGLTAEVLLTAFDRQIRNTCQQVTEINAHTHLPLPEGVRVASVRRLEQPAAQPYELERSTQ